MTVPLALTFDDGPDPAWTPRVLDALAAAEVRATFFPLSPRARRWPHVVARVRAAGHLVGLHGWGHLRHPDRSYVEVREDTLRALDALGPVAHWRLPWGLAAPWTAELAAELGLRIVGWTHDTEDWRGEGPATLLARVRPAVDGGRESVVLCHDGLGPGARRTDCAATVALIAPLVAAARAAGTRLVGVDELADPPADRPPTAALVEVPA